MSRKTIHYCDLCGNEVKHKDIIHLSNLYYIGEMDVCIDCWGKNPIAKEVQEKFVKEREENAVKHRALTERLFEKIDKALSPYK